MAGSTPFVLPQYQGSMYDLQRQQALANALMQGAMTQPQTPQAGTSGQYTVAAHTSPLAPLSNIAQGLMANRIGQQAGQGMNALGQQQFQGLMSMLGGGAGQSPQLSPGSADGGVGGAAAGSVANPFAGSDGGNGSAGTAASGPVNGVSAGPQLANNVGGGQGGGSPLNPLGMNPGMAAMMMMQSPDKYWETQAAAYKPADIVQQIRAAGIDPQSGLGRQIAQQALAKSNYIAPTSLRPGGFMYDPMSGTMQQMPSVPEGFTAQRGQNGQWQIVPVQGGLDAMGASAAAKAGGKAQYEIKEVWDPTANGGKGGMVQQSVANVANAANGTPGNAPMGIRNNNPGNLRPGGNFAQYPDMQAGLTALDNNLQSYGKQGINTVAGVISKWAPPNENDTNAYIKDVSQRLGVDPNQKIDLTNPLVRQSLSTMIALHENGPSGVFGSGGGAPAKQGGPMASQPPLGATNAANASQGAPSKQMADSYGAMSTADGSYQQSREALNEMIGLANNKGVSGAVAGNLPFGAGSRISPDAAKYEKLHATYVALQGKALGGGGTDAARATIDEAVPTYDKPQSAMVSGLQTQLNNLDMAHLKTQFLTPTYQKGDEKTYTAQSAAFDQNIKPSMIPALQLSGDAQRSAVQAAIKANPSLRSSFEWAFNNGMLK